MKISVSLLSQYNSSHQDIKKVQLPTLRSRSLPQPSHPSRTELPMTFLQDPSSEQHLNDLNKNSLEDLVSDIIDPEISWLIPLSPVSYLRETQLATYRRNENLQSAADGQILPRIDMYL